MLRHGGSQSCAKEDAQCASRSSRAIRDRDLQNHEPSIQRKFASVLCKNSIHKVDHALLDLILDIRVIVDLVAVA